MRVVLLVVSIVATLFGTGCSLVVDFDREKIDGGAGGASSAFVAPDGGVDASR